MIPGWHFDTGTTLKQYFINRTIIISSPPADRATAEKVGCKSDCRSAFVVRASDNPQALWPAGRGFCWCCTEGNVHLIMQERDWTGPDIFLDWAVMLASLWLTGGVGGRCSLGWDKSCPTTWSVGLAYQADDLSFLLRFFVPVYLNCISRWLQTKQNDLNEYVAPPIGGKLAFLLWGEVSLLCAIQPTVHLFYYHFQNTVAVLTRSIYLLL